jgi:hypothetical protein
LLVAHGAQSGVSHHVRVPPVQVLGHA